MAQLKDDCFAFAGGLMPVADALAVLKERVACVVGTEQVPLRRALGRILAESVSAPRSVPPHDNSAVDGFAVFHADLNPDGDTRLPVAGRIAAGHPLDGPAKRGHAYRIFTGAPMPGGEDGGDGPDTVFMEEDTQPDDGHVILPKGLKKGSNRRFAGEDVKAGDVILRAGRRLRAQEIGLAASVGRAGLTVRKKLRAAVFSTGDEVRDPTEEAPDGCIFDANRYTVMSLLDGLGCAVTDLGILPDNRAAIAEALAAAEADHDLLITSGGVSAGEEDHVKAAVESRGSIHFWRLAIKPGRPVALGRVGDTAFVGLPGNPVAAMVTFLLIARPLIMMLSGAADTDAPRFPVRAGFPYRKKTGRREWARAKLVWNGGGMPVAEKRHSSGAGILTSMVDADGLVELPEDLTELTEGATVDFLPFREVT
ncbi:MAG: molybdopterin molybdenumtransferase MoeA [Rhodospirillales bacterium CG15_BIG_FIL_POST_REV_8_21_14_020_66_15]|nr:MAG: molybdopterin molybdenumtransferase MoeA [Rhodospirillales bacterium CG15_BIG_FIL_POST_REV_8_21_14_020_66_15]